MPNEIPILEFDPNPEAIIDPKSCYPKNKLTEKVVVTFFKEIIDKLNEEGKIEKVAADKSEMGEHPFYKMKEPYENISLFHPGLGGPLAAALLEAAIVMGGKKFVACGSAGLLANEIHDHLVIPTSAIRDEGASYHYMAPSAEVTPSSELTQSLISFLDGRKIPYIQGKTWTTDAFFRETHNKVKNRKSSGCLTVEMEAATFFAVARFRNVEFAQMLYSSDSVSEEGWGGIVHNGTIREKMFWLSVDFLQSI